MMQGIHPRFPSKKALRETVAAGEWVALEATSIFGDEYGGPLDDAPDGTYTVVGPDPYRNRKWYASITKRDGKITVK